MSDLVILEEERLLQQNRQIDEQRNKSNKEAWIWTYIGIGILLLNWLIFTIYTSYYLVFVNELTVEIIETAPIYHYQ